MTDKPKSKTKARPKEKTKAESKAKPVAKAAAKKTTKPKTAAMTKVKAVLKKAVKPKSAAKTKDKPATKRTAKPKAAPKKATMKKISAKTMPEKKAVGVKEPAAEVVAAKPSVPVSKLVVKRAVSPPVERRRSTKKRAVRGNQFNFMKAPGADYGFEVGDTVEVFCDHEKDHDRIRGWVKGIIVQVDHKLAAVQFRSNVYLTDGWMVPDRILWFPVNSEHIRPMPSSKKSSAKKTLIPDY